MTNIIKITEKDKIEIKKLYEKDKWSVVKIAEKYNVRCASIAYHLKRMRVKKNSTASKTVAIERKPNARKLKMGKSYKDYVAESEARELKKKNNKN